MQGQDFTALEALPAPGLAEKMHKECQATMKGARAPLCRDHALSRETQRAPACAAKGMLLFPVCGLLKRGYLGWMESGSLHR